MYKDINLNAKQKFWPVKFILIAPESTKVAGDNRLQHSSPTEVLNDFHI